MLRERPESPSFSLLNFATPQFYPEVQHVRPQRIDDSDSELEPEATWERKEAKNLKFSRLFLVQERELADDLYVCDTDCFATANCIDDRNAPDEQCQAGLPLLRTNL